MAMTATPLTDLRVEIDRIDDQLHDLLMERVRVVEEIRRRKGQDGATVMQPEREASILRRLAGRHFGALGFGTVARIWREVISASIALQQPLGIAVFAPADRLGAWDLARDHYGSQVPMTVHHTINQVMRAVTDRSAAIGILPMPREEDPDPWWRQLLSRDAAAPRIIARLPFVNRGNARTTEDVLAIASHVGDIASFERSFIVIEVPGPISRTRLSAAFAGAGFTCHLLAVWAKDGPCLALAEIAGPVAMDDVRLAGLEAQLGGPFERMFHLGGYAEPLVIPG